MEKNVRSMRQNRKVCPGRFMLTDLFDEVAVCGDDDSLAGGHSYILARFTFFCPEWFIINP